jgi:hypothetical protein
MWLAPQSGAVPGVHAAHAARRRKPAHTHLREHRFFAPPIARALLGFALSVSNLPLDARRSPFATLTRPDSCTPASFAIATSFVSQP